MMIYSQRCIVRPDIVEGIATGIIHPYGVVHNLASMSLCNISNLFYRDRGHSLFYIRSIFIINSFAAALADCCCICFVCIYPMIWSDFQLDNCNLGILINVAYHCYRFSNFRNKSLSIGICSVYHCLSICIRWPMPFSADEIPYCILYIVFVSLLVI